MVNTFLQKLFINDHLRRERHIIAVQMQQLTWYITGFFLYLRIVIAPRCARTGQTGLISVSVVCRMLQPQNKDLISVSWDTTQPRSYWINLTTCVSKYTNTIAWLQLHVNLSFTTIKTCSSISFNF